MAAVSLAKAIEALRAEIANHERALGRLDAHASEVMTPSTRAALAAAKRDVATTLDDLRRNAAILEDAQKIVAQLKPSNRRGNTNEMVTSARVRISGGKGEGDPFVEAMNASHFTMRSLAEKLGVSHALFSQARTGKLSISLLLAKRIEELTGFKANRKNWPKLRD